ncbi:MAG: N6-adenosine-methyltransferase MT-A70-like protein [Bradyrhizobium sp.]|nr:N6-adenosine-methyltransferase MT-A70-like protein [Bradyrhizobium sp.]
MFNAKAPFQALKAGLYDLIDIDPPWPNANYSPKGEAKSSVAKYGKMGWEEIESLPVADLMAPHCLVRCWTTFPLLLDGGDVKRHYLGHDAGRSRPGACLRAWGLRYSTGGVWLKRSRHGNPMQGTGYRLASGCEPFFLAVKGAPKTVRGIRNWFDGVRREHSRKPEEGFDWLDALMPNAQRKIEIFSTMTRPGWDSWGYQAGKYDPVVQLREAA